LSNFPPAWRTVRTTSRADFPFFSIRSTGIPLPLSSTAIEPSLLIVTAMRVQYPARASSIELSTTSYTRWWSPLASVLPIYMAGRSRTGCRPSSTVICDASYVSVNHAPPREKCIEIPDRHTKYWSFSLLMVQTARNSEEFAQFGVGDPKRWVNRNDQPVEDPDHLGGLFPVKGARLVPDDSFPQLQRELLHLCPLVLRGDLEPVQV